MSFTRAQLSTLIQSAPLPLPVKAGFSVVVPFLPEATFSNAIPIALGIAKALLESDGERAVEIFNEHVNEADRAQALDLINTIK